MSCPNLKVYIKKSGLLGLSRCFLPGLLEAASRAPEGSQNWAPKCFQTGLLWSLLGAFLGLSRGSYLEVHLAPQGPSWGPLGTFGFMSSCWPTWPLSWARPRPFGGGPILTTIFILFNLRLSELSWGTLELSWGSLGYLFGLAWGSLGTPLLGRLGLVCLIGRGWMRFAGQNRDPRTKSTFSKQVVFVIGWPLGLLFLTDSNWMRVCGLS